MGTRSRWGGGGGGRGGGGSGRGIANREPPRASGRRLRATLVILPWPLATGLSCGGRGGSLRPRTAAVSTTAHAPPPGRGRGRGARQGGSGGGWAGRDGGCGGGGAVVSGIIATVPGHHPTVTCSVCRWWWGPGRSRLSGWGTVSCSRRSRGACGRGRGGGLGQGGSRRPPCCMHVSLWHGRRGPGRQQSTAAGGQDRSAAVITSCRGWHVSARRGLASAGACCHGWLIVGLSGVRADIPWGWRWGGRRCGRAGGDGLSGCLGGL